VLAVQRAPATMGPWTWRCSLACGGMGCFEPCCQHELLVRNFANADSKFLRECLSETARNRNARLSQRSGTVWKQHEEQAKQRDLTCDSDCHTTDSAVTTCHKKKRKVRKVKNYSAACLGPIYDKHTRCTTHSTHGKQSKQREQLVVAGLQ